MTTIVEFSMPTDEIGLCETLTSFPNIEFEADRIATHDTSNIIPLVWAMGTDLEGLTPALEADPSVKEVERLAAIDGKRLYRTVWTTHSPVVEYMLTDWNAAIKRATVSGTQWQLRVLFPDRTGVSAVHDYAEESGLSLDIGRMYDIGGKEGEQHDLTNIQYEALTAALARGYYDIPRTVTQAELATELDISHQALSERLRRGTKGLIKTVLMGKRPGDQ